MIDEVEDADRHFAASLQCMIGGAGPFMKTVIRVCDFVIKTSQ
jgi:hypothetical protein